MGKRIAPCPDGNVLNDRSKDEMKAEDIFMPFPEPQRVATFLDRPQRFLAEMQLPGGMRTLAYCANPGTFHGCLRAGSQALLWDSANPKRKRRYTLRAVNLKGCWIGTDTHLSNRVAERILQQNLLPTLRKYEILGRDVLAGAGVRIDFLMSNGTDMCFLEVKSAVVAERRVARFPDSVTPRALKHLKFLTRKAANGHRAVLLFIVQRNDVERLEVNSVHYPEYTDGFRTARKAGVEVLACAVPVSPTGFGIPRPIPVSLE